jgi:hypothetical protein
MMRRLLPAVLFLGAAVGPLACRERGRPDPNIQMAISHEPEEASPAAEGGQQAPGIPNRLEVPEAVQQAYSGIVLLWKDASNGKEGKLEVPLGGSAPLPGSTLTVSSDVFLPAFTMTSEVITSAGIEPENPAARIRVTDGGKEIFTGWIFKRFPDVHPFTHPRFSFVLDGGVRKTAA